MEEIRYFRDLAGEIAREAGELVKSLYRRDIVVERKGMVDLVTEADLKSEAFIMKRISERFPDHEILAEEAGGGFGKTKHLWIVDPLDGTTNYAHGYPVYAVSIALEMDGVIVAGAVYDPNLKELFKAARGEGATLNGEKIGVSHATELHESLLVTGFPYYFRERPDEILALFRAFSLRAQGIRRAGSAALDMCALACGRFDGFWELGLKPWDTAAGSLILTEAGGRLSKLDGSSFDIRMPELLASNSKIHERMLKTIKESKTSRKARPQEKQDLKKSKTSRKARPQEKQDLKKSKTSRKVKTIKERFV
ncbi:MAG: inositol monophosphatase [Actinobacteria bacterium]|nr:inositol monophosphatase [Actinomycetota bacterium]